VPATTSTTVAGTPGQPLIGSTLVLRDNPTRPRAQRLLATSRDSHIDVFDTRGTDDDPTLAGGSLRVRTTAGDTFDMQFVLPASGWRTIGRPEEPRGYKYRTDGAVRSITIKSGGVLRIAGSGADLALSLQTNPNPVRVDLTIGGRSYCMQFGGDATFKPGRRFVARASLAPAQCN
jgi:hypothetical protein